MSTPRAFYILPLIAVAVLGASLGVSVQAQGVTDTTAIYVAPPPAGDDSYTGSSLLPVATLSKAIQLAAAASPRKPVHVAAGAYTISTTLSLASGVHVYGQFSGPPDWQRDAQYETIISGPATAVLAQDIAEETHLEGFTIRSADAAGLGQSSYALRIVDSAGPVVVRFNTILPGHGAAGLGGFPGISGLAGDPGQPGEDGQADSSGGGAGGATALEGRACYAGLDLSSTSDLTTLVLVFPPESEEEPYYVLPFFWLPEDTLSLRVRRDHVMYDVWKAQNFLMTTEGNVVHYGFIEQFIVSLGERYNIREIAYDRWNATMMVQALEDDGFTMIPFGQGFRDMSPPTKELMRIVLERKLAHGGHPVLRWNLDNAFVRTDPAGNQKIDKEKSTEKVDGAVALIMALDRAMKNQGTGGSVYDGRGLLFI